MRDFRSIHASLGDLIGFYRADGRALLDESRRRVIDARAVVFAGASGIVEPAIFPRLAAEGIIPAALGAAELLRAPRLAARCLPILVFGAEDDSGAHADSGLHALAEAGVGRSQFLAITNDPGAPGASMAEVRLPLRASTPSALRPNLLALLHLLAARIEGALDRAYGELEEARAHLLDSGEEELREAASHLFPADAVVFAGGGPALPAARGAARSLMRRAASVAAAYEPGELDPEAFRRAASRARLVVFSPAGPTSSRDRRLAEEAAASGTKVLLVAEAVPPVVRDGVRTLEVPVLAAARREELFSLLVSALSERLFDALERAGGGDAPGSRGER